MTYEIYPTFPVILPISTNLDSDDPLTSAGGCSLLSPGSEEVAVACCCCERRTLVEAVRWWMRTFCPAGVSRSELEQKPLWKRENINN